ncbi:uncharacterized protein LOC113375418 [Ctenocephalides felis]|uniref:uncharacterized protein LOC113375418 n=1 Tax=Ctenocephalides felis TaxID=7515 RepID=UPI000E6E2D1A|nr:uncharacterized protein LOC113375418 [Ctenocephalides felis]
MNMHVLCSAATVQIQKKDESSLLLGQDDKLSNNEFLSTMDLTRNARSRVDDGEMGIPLAQSKYFQDIFSGEVAPLIFEFGHIMESPSSWEQRFEKRDINAQRHQGKVRWGHKDGSYGEHYWDLHTSNDDDGNEGIEKRDQLKESNS